MSGAVPDTVVPDATEHEHAALVALMKADAARQEPLVDVIGSMLEETVTRNDVKQKQSSLPSFTAGRPPLTASAFVARIAKYSGASPCCYAIGLIYLERMKKRDTGLYLNSTNFQRLFLVATMVAAKFLDDFYYSNKHWAQIGGLTLSEVNKLELEFLFRMGFSLHMQREEYDWYAEELLSRVAAEPLPTQACSAPKEKEIPAEQHEDISKGGQPAFARSGSTSSFEDVESFLSSQSTPKTSSCHLVQDLSSSTKPPSPHSAANTSTHPMYHEPSLSTPLSYHASAVGMPMMHHVHHHPGMMDVPNATFDAHISGATALHAGLMPQVLGSAVPAYFQSYAAAAAMAHPQPPWVYY